MGEEGYLCSDSIIMPDINDYGKFEKFYEPLPKEREDPWRQKEPETPLPRPDPFRLALGDGSAQEKPPTTPVTIIEA